MAASPPRRHLHLNAFLMNAGHHDAAWRHPRTTPERVTDLTYFQELARTAERGLFDSVFLADGLALWGNVRYNALGGFEPLTLLSALAGATERIGLIATVSTTYNEPFTTARAFASLDHLSGGRAGWNIVTSGNVDEARNFGRDEHLEHGLRYERAREFVDVAVKLWESWADDAIVLDRAAGVYADTGKVRPIDHRGKHFRVRGPLNVPRSPQGHPLLVQAGSSEDGKEFAARYAEAVFTAQQTLADAQAFFKDLKSRVARRGRAEDDVKVLPGICPVIGSTEAEARALEQELTDLQIPEYGLAQLSGMLGTDLTGLPLDGPLPELPSERDINGNKSRFTLVAELARRDGLTLRELIARLGGGRGHRVVAGTAEQIADQLQEWFTQGAADGFNIMPPYLPGGLDHFVDQVVPILQARGLFRTEYTGRTLREHYGLPRPTASRATAPEAAARAGATA
ncbi:LLM class flavin-dependent oxidoreductase [Streptomyces sp. WAC05374]|uniref:LLM class flavin-dependent oxidoreductase n=1 Tax=Streptomyces sp. WAC05374 TaxID=2487420 RepID=UPI000F87B353|nr:LLM class flavin-dependent oxidoreductase [Streptomyces sp. WAC05374]RST14722.1 LLM class flavin-dependent oxidoreductase [Streptomyces sp. WAC05374]TDF45881.1 LLM class flavin-dependent oxidoreductase [Streptomyces sp. WAC05374]TDF48109.1 LLM class flavin-dependent oxidoreductase [Streptomyces sp. WAC05374]TDF52876.1 LLM class flavin-dependent oxidoreductase [Streptomyces sp. WAC05374]